MGGEIVVDGQVTEIQNGVVFPLGFDSRDKADFPQVAQSPNFPLLEQQS